MNIQIDNSQKTDRDDIYDFYSLTIADTFAKNGIDDPEEINSEVAHQMKTFDSPEDLLMVAKIDENIIGTIAYGKMNKSVSSNIPEKFLKLKEIKCVYIHPDYQNKGIGSFLWRSILFELKRMGIKEVCLDSGYRLSQKYWKKKIGEPTFLMKDYWGEGEDQMIWIFKINPIIKKIT